MGFLYQHECSDQVVLLAYRDYSVYGAQSAVGFINRIMHLGEGGKEPGDFPGLKICEIYIPGICQHEDTMVASRRISYQTFCNLAYDGASDVLKSMAITTVTVCVSYYSTNKAEITIDFHNSLIFISADKNNFKFAEDLAKTLDLLYINMPVKKYKEFNIYEHYRYDESENAYFYAETDDDILHVESTCFSELNSPRDSEEARVVALEEIQKRIDQSITPEGFSASAVNSTASFDSIGFLGRIGKFKIVFDLDGSDYITRAQYDAAKGFFTHNFWVYRDIRLLKTIVAEMKRCGRDDLYTETSWPPFNILHEIKPVGILILRKPSEKAAVILFCDCSWNVEQRIAIVIGFGTNPDYKKTGPIYVGIIKEGNCSEKKLPQQ